MENSSFSESSLDILKIKLKIFEGPLDLLLHLIRTSKVDIYDIPMAEITAQYLEYLDLMKDLNLDVASEFLIMAATLTHIKSRMLLPASEEDEDEEDPRSELVQRLLEYQKYKEASLRLGDMMRERGRLYERDAGSTPLIEEEIYMEVSVFELLKAFREVISLSAEGPAMTIHPDKFTVVDKMREIADIFNTERKILFQDLFKGSFDRSEIVASFLAILELVRMRMIRLIQEAPGGEIVLVKVES